MRLGTTLIYLILFIIGCIKTEVYPPASQCPEQASSVVCQEFNISDVPCDSLYSLVKVLTKLLEGSTEEVVEWSLEPKFAVWTFKRKDNEIELSVSCPAGSIPVLIFQCEAVNMIQRISKSLRELGVNPVWKEDDASERIWSWDFPSNLLKLLEKKLANNEPPS